MDSREKEQERRTVRFGEKHGGIKHWGLMLLCCVPMIAIFLLIALGSWSW